MEHETDEGSFRVVEGKVYLWDVGIGSWRLVGRELAEGESPERAEFGGVDPLAKANYWTEAKAKKYFGSVRREQDIASRDTEFEALAGEKYTPDDAPKDVYSSVIADGPKRVESVRFGSSTWGQPLAVYVDGIRIEPGEKIALLAGQTATVNFVGGGGMLEPNNHNLNADHIQTLTYFGNGKVFCRTIDDVSGKPGDIIHADGKSMGVLESIEKFYDRNRGLTHVELTLCSQGTVTSNVSGCYPIRYVTDDGFELNIWPGTEVSHAGKIYTCGWDYNVTVRDCLPETPKGCKHDWRPSSKGKKWCASCGVYENPKPPDFPAPEPTPPMPDPIEGY